jgi:hypothetical protein
VVCLECNFDSPTSRFAHDQSNILGEIKNIFYWHVFVLGSALMIVVESQAIVN